MDYRLLFDMNASGDMGVYIDSTQPDPAPTRLQIFAIVVVFTFPAIALVIVMIRAAGRIAIRQFGWDDALISIAMVFSLIETVLSYFFIKTNFIGIHIQDIPKNRDRTQALIWLYAVQILYNPILALVKSSALLFLQRLFGQKDGIRRLIIGLNIVNILQMVATFFAITLQCLPIAFNWDLTISNGRCIDRRILYTFTSSFNILTDLMVIGLPLWIFASLKIPRPKKIALIFVFLLGFLVTITSIVRLVLIVQGLFGLVTLSDPTYNIGFVTSAIETNLALITASAPALRPFLRKRDRGGWLGRSSVSPTKMRDVEAVSEKKPFGWPLSAKFSGTGTPKTPKSPKKIGRGGSRGGRRGGRSGRGRGGSTKKYDIRIRRDNGGAAELRSRSPRSSEEETMTSNGIMRVSDIQREIDGIVKEIAVEGSGTYTGVPRPAANTAPRPSSRRGRETGNRGGAARSATAPRLLTNFPPTVPPKQQQQQQQQGGVRTQSNINNFRDTGFDFFNQIPPPSEEVATPARRQFPERYYSESVYPELEYYTGKGRDDDRDWNEERISKYGERRFGVVTPRTANTPTTAGSRGWRESGRPF